MANALYAKGREGFLDGSIDWDTNTISMIGMDHADDTPVPATDDNLDDLLAAGRVGSWTPLGTKTVTDGVADAANITATAVTGDPFESLNIYKDTGVEATSRLIAYIDAATGLPCTPNSGDITVQWDDGANKIFKL